MAKKNRTDRPVRSRHKVVVFDFGKPETESYGDFLELIDDIKPKHMKSIRVPRRRDYITRLYTPSSPTYHQKIKSAVLAGYSTKTASSGQTKMIEAKVREELRVKFPEDFK